MPRNRIDQEEDGRIAESVVLGEGRQGEDGDDEGFELAIEDSEEEEKKEDVLQDVKGSVANNMQSSLIDMSLLVSV